MFATIVLMLKSAFSPPRQHQQQPQQHQQQQLQLQLQLMAAEEERQREGSVVLWALLLDLLRSQVTPLVLILIYFPYLKG